MALHTYTVLEYMPRSREKELNNFFEDAFYNKVVCVLRDQYRYQGRNIYLGVVIYEPFEG